MPLAQSGDSSCVSVLMMRRFWSAAVVRSEAFQSQSATMMTNARTSAVALNAPRPAHLARKIACRFTSGGRLCAGVSPSARGMPRDGADHHDLRGVCQGNRCGRESAEYIDDVRTPGAFSRPLASSGSVACSLVGVRFAEDSTLEEIGFELVVRCRAARSNELSSHHNCGGRSELSPNPMRDGRLQFLPQHRRDPG